jgi:hypothetical protein
MSKSDEREERVIREDLRCPGCQCLTNLEHLFCMKCGVKNPYFEPEVVQENGYGSVEVMKTIECAMFHPIVTLDTPDNNIASLLEGYRELPFCPSCGRDAYKYGIN